MESKTQTVLIKQPSVIQNTVFLLLFIATFFIYSPGLKGDFILDDQTTVANNQNIKITSLDLKNLQQGALSSNAGPLKRPVSMLTFSIDYYLHGLKPYYFKLTNLIIHLLNGLIVFLLTKLLIDAYSKTKNLNIKNEKIFWISLFTTAAWLLHPLNLTSVLYVSQRMTSLSALFTFAGLALYAYGRNKANTPHKSIIAIALAFILCWPLATLSKENGALLPLLLLILEVTIFRFRASNPSARLSLKLTYVLTVALPATALACFIYANPDWITRGYLIRDFTLYERLLTESRVLWFYISLIFFPRTSAMGIYHDDFQISEGLLNPITTILSITGLTLAIITAIWLRKRQPLISFGILFFVAGHCMESSIFSLELIYEHRNYVPIYGILLVIAYSILNPNLTKNRITILKYFAALAIFLCAVLTYERANYWGQPFLHHLYEVKNHPQSARANYEVGRVYAQLIPTQKYNVGGNYQAAREHFEVATNVDKNYMAGLFGLITLNQSLKKEPEKIWITDLKTRLANSPISSTSADWLTSLTNCSPTTPCVLPNDTLIDLFNIALSNTSLASKKKAYVLSALASFYANQLNDLQSALTYAEEAKDVLPKNANYKLNFARILIALNRKDEANKELIEARALDILGEHKARIITLEKLISEKHVSNYQAESL